MEYTVTVLPQGRGLPAAEGRNLLEVLREAGLAPEAPCGGQGTCGKCMVEIDGAPALACQTRVTSDLTVRLPERRRTRILTGGEMGSVSMDPAAEGLLLAFDIGTTTVVGYLLEGGTGRELACASMLNPQSPYGADVVTRIQAALNGEMGALTGAIRRGLSELTEKLCQEAGARPGDVGVVSVVGNPCMQQLFMGIRPDNLVQIPFEPALKRAEIVPAGACLPVCPNARLLVVPDISGYVGADTIGCVIATGMDRASRLCLLVDIGTNGEMVLGSREGLVACSTAAGPALEGARIRCGMRAAPGAIDHVWWEDGALRCSVIGGGPAAGICGSGIIDAAAVLLERGALNSRGRLQPPEACPALADRLGEAEGRRVCFLRDGVYLTQEDIREVQLAKGAIAAGIELMAAYLPCSLEEIGEVLLAGAFGSFIRPENACRIGLLPPALADRVRAVGNAAGSGTRMIACSRAELQRAEELAKTVTLLELASLKEFRRSFAKNMAF